MGEVDSSLPNVLTRSGIAWKQRLKDDCTKEEQSDTETGKRCTCRK